MSRLPGESWESFAERKIRQAMIEGEFDHLPGFGHPIPEIDQPWDENSWVRRKLRDEQINALPPILEARLDREKTLELIQQISLEREVIRQLSALNDRIRQAHFASAAGPSEGVFPVDIEAELIRWRQHREHRNQTRP